MIMIPRNSVESIASSPSSNQGANSGDLDEEEEEEFHRRDFSQGAGSGTAAYPPNLRRPLSKLGR